MAQPGTFVKGLADCANCGHRFSFQVRRDHPPDLGFGHGKPVYCFNCEPIFPRFMPTEVLELPIDGEPVQFVMEINDGQEARSHAIYEWFFEL